MNELSARQNEFITITVNGEEYGIECIKRVATHANIDDSTTHLTLKASNCRKGNIII